jgi:hypothetical protein
MWGQFADNIVAEAVWLDSLEELIDYFRVNFEGGRGVKLNRSRLVDIVTWGEGVGEYQSLRRHGQHLLSSVPDPGTW